MVQRGPHRHCNKGEAQHLKQLEQLQLQKQEFSEQLALICAHTIYLLLLFAATAKHAATRAAAVELRRRCSPVADYL